MSDGQQVYAFTEIELDEISLAPRQAVPGADVLGVRTAPALSMESAQALVEQLRKTFPPEQFAQLIAVPASDDESGSAPPSESDDESSSEVLAVTYADRLDAFRRSLITHP